MKNAVLNSFLQTMFLAVTIGLISTGCFDGGNKVTQVDDWNATKYNKKLDKVSNYDLNTLYLFALDDEKFREVAEIKKRLKPKNEQKIRANYKQLRQQLMMSIAKAKNGDKTELMQIVENNIKLNTAQKWDWYRLEFEPTAKSLLGI